MTTEPPVPADDGGTGDGGGGDPHRGRRAVAVGIGLIVAVLLFFALAGRTKKPKSPPDDLIHRAAMSSRKAEVCLDCHARGSELDRPANHTGRQDCWSCHLFAD